jgi:hypothetical protein
MSSRGMDFVSEWIWQRVVTGTVTEFHAGVWMSVAYEGADPMFRVALRETTANEGSSAAINPDVRVTVGVSERASGFR